MNSIYLNICDIKSIIELPGNNHFLDVVSKRYQNFIEPLDKEVKDFRLALKTISKQSNNKPSVWRMNGVWAIKGAGFDCKISRNNSNISGVGVTRPNIYTFDSLLRVIWTQLLLLRNGFLVHACGLSNGGESYLFPGKSGRGKSTLAKKSPPANVLSDELVGVQIKNGESMLMGTPFWGEFQQGGSPISQKLRGIYFLEKSNSLRIIKISSQDAMTRLLRCILFFNNDSSDIKRLLKIAADCVSNTPSYRICLTKQVSYEEIMKIIRDRK